MGQNIVTVGGDLANNVFKLHAIGANGKVLVCRQLRHAKARKFSLALPPCLVGMEACASTHHLGRELIALGHHVRRMPPAYVKPYAKRGKTDAADAGAICDAITRPTIRIVQMKTPLTSVSFMSAIEDPRRFRRSQDVGAYFGLTHIATSRAKSTSTAASPSAEIASPTSYCSKRPM